MSIVIVIFYTMGVSKTLRSTPLDWLHPYTRFVKFSGKTPNFRFDFRTPINQPGS